MLTNFISYKPKNTILEFDDTDNKKLYRINLKKQSNDWIYRSKKVYYNFNKHGFRNCEFKKVKWSKSIVVFGDSITFGCGLAEEDTISKQLERILDIPTVNLGISAAGTDLACVNSLILHENFPRPRAVVHVRTSLGRYTDFDFNENIAATPYLAHWKNYYYKLNWEERSKLYILSDRALWKNKVPYSEITFFTCAKDFGIKQINKIDLARDQFHPGITSCLNAAETIAKNLKEQGI